MFGRADAGLRSRRAAHVWLAGEVSLRGWV